MVETQRKGTYTGTRLGENQALKGGSFRGQGKEISGAGTDGGRPGPKDNNP